MQGLAAFKAPPGYMHEAPGYMHEAPLARRKKSNVKTKPDFRPFWDVFVTQWSESACATPFQHLQVPATNEVLFSFQFEPFLLSLMISSLKDGDVTSGESCIALHLF